MLFEDGKKYRRLPPQNEKFLRGSSITIGDTSNYEHHPTAEYKAEYIRHTTDKNLTAAERTAVSNLLRKTNYELGDGKGDFVTSNSLTYVRPREGEQFTPSIDTNELQRSHLVLGDQDSASYEKSLEEGFKTSNRVDYDVKPIPKDPSLSEEMLNMLRREHWSIGDPSQPVNARSFDTTNQVTYVPHPDPIENALNERTKADLRKSHISFGGGVAASLPDVGTGAGALKLEEQRDRGMLPQIGEIPDDRQFETTYRVGYTLPDQTVTRGLTNAGEPSGIIPAKVDANTRHILRAHHYQLGDNHGEYSTTYTDAYVPKPLDPEVWVEVTE